MRRIKELAIVFCIILGLFICGLILPCSCADRTRGFADERYWARLNIKMIVLAMYSYLDVHGTLPPRVVYGKDGKPLYSWRVLLLPYLDHEATYKKFKLNEPWDSPHNKQLLERTPSSLAGGADPGFTCCQVFVGPGTAFERDGLTFKDLKKDFPDGLDNTIFVVEAKEQVPWSKPVDLTYDPDGPLPELGGHFTYSHRFLNCRFGERPGFMAAFGDGSGTFILSGNDEKVIRALITRNGGEKESREDLRW
jgi:hypothetical protein